MSNYRKHDKKKGKCCLIWTNLILLLIGLCLVGYGYWIYRSLTIPEELSKVNFSFVFVLTTGTVLIVYSFIGLLSVCGGCMLYTFVTISVILSCIFAILSLISIYILILSFSTSRQQLWNEVKLPLQRAINTLSESQWKLVQDSLQCCGYMKQNRTATICTESTSDCETFLYGQMDMLYIVAAFIIVLFVLLVIADSSSCSWMRALRLL